MNATRRLVLVSNRLAFRIAESPEGPHVVAASGGVATALRDLQRKTNALWLGWPGAVKPSSRLAAARALAEVGAQPLFLSDGEIRGYYEGYANGVLWPLLHSHVDKLPFDAGADYDVFRGVNERFADACADVVSAGDEVWIHDFQLALLPAALRRRARVARVGFFHHVPFPSPDVFRVLPHARDILAGMLGADLVGFHTRGYLEAFKACVRAIGARVVADTVEFAGHATTLGVFPIGVDFEKLDATAALPDVATATAAIRADAGDRTILLGVDRLDYTKGLPRRMLAIERMLERWPELAPRVRVVQLAVPTRENVDAYADFRGVVNELVGRINSRFATPSGVPIHFMHRELPFHELVALYAAADVMLVTPLRDGMNLVAKEYVAARADEHGALVLSELAGAADELTAAVLVNPFDVDEMARRMREAILMPPEEQRGRMTAMRRVVSSQTVHRWAASFVSALGACSERHELGDELQRATSADKLHIVLDYDGTLVPLAPTPAQADPDPALLALLRSLGDCPSTEVTIVSGRDRSTLHEWLGGLPLSLVAEHGAHRRRRDAAEWATSPVPPWKKHVVLAATAFSASRPGTFVEQKDCSVALHTRGVPPEDRKAVEDEAAALFAKAAADASILRGDCVVEVRDGTLHKGRVVPQLQLAAGHVVLAAGDDATDEDLFAALPLGSVAIAVGARPRLPRHRVSTAFELREILARIASARRTAAAAAKAPPAGAS